MCQPGDIIKIKNEGMPIHENSAESGDLYVKIDVYVPELLTEAQKESKIKHLNLSRKNII